MAISEEHEDTHLAWIVADDWSISSRSTVMGVDEDGWRSRSETGLYLRMLISSLRWCWEHLLQFWCYRSSFVLYKTTDAACLHVRLNVRGDHRIAARVTGEELCDIMY